MADEPTQQTAANVMETFHVMMRAVGREARKQSTDEVPFHQFRALMTIRHHEGASLSQVAEHLGATLSAASKIVDHLVERGYVRRETAEADRRRLILALTDAGEEAVNSVKLRMHTSLAEKLALLTPGECSMLDLAMDILRSALVPAQTGPNKQSTNPRHSEQREESHPTTEILHGACPEQRRRVQNDGVR